MLLILTCFFLKLHKCDDSIVCSYFVALNKKKEGAPQLIGSRKRATVDGVLDIGLLRVVPA